MVAVLLFYVLLPVFVLGLALCFQMPVEGMMVKRIKDVSRQGGKQICLKNSFGLRYPTQIKSSKIGTLDMSQK